MGIAAWEQRFSEYLRKLFGTRESGAFELLPDIMPVAAVLDPSAPELALLRNERLITGGRGISAAAAQFPTVWVGLPNTAANVLLVVESMVVSVIATQQVQWSAVLGTFLGSTPSLTTRMLPNDGRFGGSTPCQAMLGASSEVASFGIYPQAAVLLNQPVLLPVNVVLLPGQYMGVQGQLANSMLQVAFFGYEREVSQSEYRTR